MNYDIPVTTGDLKRPYEIIGPVYFQVTNKGLFLSPLDKLVKKYKKDIENMKRSGTMSGEQLDWGFLYGEWSLLCQSDFEKAFFVATEELKKRARMLGADAIVCMRQDVDMLSGRNGSLAYFYMQMYGTAVRFTEETFEQVK